jgi:hypothetical protein
MHEESNQEQEVAALNRRKPENRWRRILRDAEWDQHESVRRWLKLARKVFEKDDEDQPPKKKDDKESTPRAA